MTAAMTARRRARPCTVQAPRGTVGHSFRPVESRKHLESLSQTHDAVFLMKAGEPKKVRRFP